MNSYNTPYKFNAKELDDETGYYYYGARYYNPRVSLWLGLDPLASYDPIMNAEHYIDGEHNGGVLNSGNLNPYIYTYNNPIIYVDPNGKQVNVVTYGIKGKFDDGYIKNVANTSAKGIGVTARGISNGDQLISLLQSSGRIASFVNWGHSWNVGLYLNNNSGFYSDSYFNSYNLNVDAASLSDLKSSGIKTNAHSLFIFASCGTAGAGSYDSTSFAASFGNYIDKSNDVGQGTWNYKVTTIGATNLSNLLEDGTLKTDGRFVMTEKRFQISKKAIYQTTGMLWWKETSFLRWDIKTKLLETKTTDLGNKINPTTLIKNHNYNDTKID